MRDDLALLARWPEVFDFDQRAVSLAKRWNSPEARSAALSTVVNTLAAEGRITGWRNETYAIRNAFDDLPLAFIERAASRFFGIVTYGVNLNGIVPAASGAPMMWQARRSLQKSTDPGLLDTLVGGGIGWGYSVREALLKESWEESGVPAELAQNARLERSLYILKDVSEGAHVEQIFIYDLILPSDFVPENQDGEVSEHQLADFSEIWNCLQDASMTVDASLSALDHLLRAGWVAKSACPGYAALSLTPTLSSSSIG
jgi:ADP-ribose pyrophosphatase YjhB (NUDIX family)